MNSFTKISLLPVLFALLLSYSAKASEPFQKDLGPAPIRYGAVLFASLADFAPDSATPAVDQLKARQFDAAYSSLQAQYARYPNSFAVIAGLLQASIGEPSPNFLDETLQELGQKPEEQLTVPDRFRLAAALFYQWGCGWPKPDKNLLRRSQRILNELWQTGHDPIAGLMLAETTWGSGDMRDPNIHIDISAIQEQIICSLITPAAARQFRAASQDGWQGSAPSLDEVPIANRDRLLCVVAGMYDLNAVPFNIGRMEGGKYVWSQVPFTPWQKEVQNYITPWFIALGKATGLKIYLYKSSSVSN